MVKNIYSKFTASYLDCLSMLESNTAVLYTALADKVNMPQVKSVLLGAANDSQKHSMQLKGAVENLARTKAKPRGDGKLDGVFNVTYSIYKEIIDEEEITQEDLLALAEKLAVLEKILAEKYVFVQSKTSQFPEKESDPFRGEDLDYLGSMFARIIDDGEQHQKLLGDVKEFVEQKAKKSADSIELASCVASASLTISRKSK